MSEFSDDDDSVTVGSGKKSAQKRVKKYEDEQLRLDVIAIMDTAAGRRYMHHLLDFGGINRTSFTGNSTTFFNEGARNFALKIKGDVQDFAPAHYLLMQKEAMNNE